MAAPKKTVSVVRVSKQTLSQINPNDTVDPTDRDTSVSQSKVQIPTRVDRVFRNKTTRNDFLNTKTEVFTLNLPRTSDAKSDELNHPISHIDSHRTSSVIQQQPTQKNTWLKRVFHSTTRPGINWKQTNHWNNSLCSFSHDCNMCCYACACWCCFRHEISSMMDEPWYLWYLNCAPLIELRTKFRQQYNIQGSIAEDFCLATCCPLCVALQLANEGREYGHRIFS